MSMWMHSMKHGSGSAIPARFCEGDIVNVLNPFRLPQMEEVRHTGAVTRIQERDGGEATLYWIQGLPCARTASVLRLVKRAR